MHEPFSINNEVFDDVGFTNVSLTIKRKRRQDSGESTTTGFFIENIKGVFLYYAISFDFMSADRDQRNRLIEILSRPDEFFLFSFPYKDEYVKGFYTFTDLSLQLLSEQAETNEWGVFTLSLEPQSRLE